MAKLNIYVEVTHVYHTDLNTGIQRVVRNVLREMLVVAERDPDMLVIPVLYTGRNLITAGPEEVLRDKSYVLPPVQAEANEAEAPVRVKTRFTTRIKHGLKHVFAGIQRVLVTVLPFTAVRKFVYAPADEFGFYSIALAGVNLVRGARNRLNMWRAQRGARRTSAVVLDPATAPHGTDLTRLVRRDGGDRNILLLLDSSWNHDLWPAAVELKLQGVEVTSIIYDLIPLTHPHTCVSHLNKIFEVWMAGQMMHADSMICISQYIRDIVVDYTAKHAVNGREIPVSWFHLGSELDFHEGGEAVPAVQASAPQDGVFTFLMVGSIEPRKNHRLVFDAFKLLWASGKQARLVIVGKRGWKTEELIDEMQAHPEFGRQLFLFRDASDTDVEWLYHHASALVMASEVEGFGLPVVESAQRGLPVICSDIPVFRELAIPGTTYFPLDGPMAAAQAIGDYIASHDLAAPRVPYQWMTWKQSTEQMLGRMGIGPMAPAGVVQSVESIKNIQG